MKQVPNCDDYLLRWKGEVLSVSLKLDHPRAGRAVLRTNLGGASVRRREIIKETEEGKTPLARAWRDVPMRETAPGEYVCEVRLDEIGIFSGKCCFFPRGSSIPEWPEGSNFHVKVESASTRRGNSIYTVFPRQFGSFREVKRRLGHIMDRLGFRIVQTLPPFPVPVTYAVMGEYGCPFAATDLFSVDPAMAEFDQYATPLDQFRELIDAVHAKGGSFFVDLPANHTGWASTLQTHHPQWFHRAEDGRFVSPGAWGVTWADLVELDYANAGLRAYMAEVFLFWCRQGVDGFRCDAGYMIPESVWTYIVARVREEYPDTVFMLEGLGGKLEVTDALLSRAGLDWAYSEIFQTYDRGAFEWYLPGAIARAEKYGALVHFAETHDNDRLAKGGETYARLRVALAALLSHQGAWGIANGVEWFATEKIDVHGKNDLAWDNPRNQVELIARLNHILSSHPDFSGNPHLELIERGDGNFLAVRRGDTLVLANLDCVNGVEAHWDEAKFGPGEARELISGRLANLSSGYWLGPGEVLCFSRVRVSSLSTSFPSSDSTALSPFVWRWPEDAKREVCVPSGEKLAFECDYPYRALLLENGRAWPELPPYSGDGTRARRFELEFTAFTPDGPRRTLSEVLVLPGADAARVKLVYSGVEIRRNLSEPGAGGLLETMLSDGAGAASRVKLAWGEVRSQYDALFAANPNPHVPADRLTLWTRCRAWLQHEGYSREINVDCIDHFRADPAGRVAEWFFMVPCGLGRVVKFVFRLALAADGTGAAKLMVERLPVEGQDDVGPVTVVFRPDLEWRSFHGTTKAQGAVENAFAGATRVLGKAGFVFAPYSRDEQLVMHVTGGEFHPEGAWSYCVSHAEEAERGQEGCGDIYSPGWMSCSFDEGDEAVISAMYVSSVREKNFDEQGAARLRSRRGVPARASAPSLPLGEALCEAMKLFIVKRDDVKTVIAGYPWFLDWGRDTFIFLQGAIPAGFRREALEIVEAFARFEDKGTLPNIIYGETAGNRDTVDAPLWFIRTLAVLGKEAAKFRPVAESIVENYVKGTANGIHMDAESALVWSPAHFTWMDTNYPACTPRCGYPVEIQALWIAALRYLGGKKWNELADRAAASLVKYFANGNGLADCLDAPNGEGADQARRDDAVRPNQLFALSLGALEKVTKIEESTRRKIEESILSATWRLVVPGGVRSLAADHSLYRGIYAGDEDTSRKPAYHNGTVWAWPFPMWAEAAAAAGVITREAALSLLGSAVENLNGGCVCHLSEIADGDAPHAQRGCAAQAWSESEFLRVWLKLGGA